ncbi:MAG: His/Gly/Thr/Pro-type tRNA ligase C-terminal domain-containing protein [Patescibacteria group bacterium]
MAQRSIDKVKPSVEYWVSHNITKAFEIALYYGFNYISPIVVEKSDIDALKNLDVDDLIAITPHVKPDEELAVLRQHVVKNLGHLPFTLFRDRIVTDKKSTRHECCLDIIGTTRPISDATVIKTAYEIARKEGFENLELEINSIGDKDSLARFNRELTNYFKKHLNELDPECKQVLKKDVFAAITCTHEKCQTIKNNAPKAINYLSEPSRTHLKEILEQLEMSNILYSINSCLIDGHNFASHTIFRIYATENEKRIVVASGCRWGGLAKRLGLKKDIQGISAVVSINKQEPKAAKKLPKPKFFFIQMGQEAKMRSLMLIEILREANIPIYHALTKDKLTAQLSSAENLNVPYILIMGQKESMERTVLVREMYNRSQETVKIDAIADYLRKLI